jgi:AraC-like DNA-binding protein
MESSILASAGRILWRYLEKNNIDADALFRKFGLEPSSIQGPRTRFPLKLLQSAWAEAATITQNENIGLESAIHYTPLDLNALGVTFLSSATLMEALQRLKRYESVLNSSLTVSLVETENRLDVFTEVSVESVELMKIMEDSRQSILINLCRLGLSDSLDPVEVAFTYPQPKNTGDHFAVFRCPLLFSQPSSRITFDLSDTQRQFTAANREIAVNSDQILDAMIRDLDKSDLVTRVKRAIVDDLPSGTPSEEDIASRVHVSCRTLQRRLADENTSFRKLILEVRHELAEKYISDKDMPLAEISYMLGFADTSSFSRAFKRWTGDSPAAYRSNAQAG